MGDITDVETVEYFTNELRGGIGNKVQHKSMFHYTGNSSMVKSATIDFDEFKSAYTFMKSKDKNNTLPPFSQVHIITERRGKDMMGTKGLTYTEFALTDNKDNKYYVRDYDDPIPLRYEPNRSIASDLKLIKERSEVESHIEKKSDVNPWDKYVEMINKEERDMQANKKVPKLKVKWILLKMHWTFNDDRYMKLAKQLQKMLNLRERPSVPASQNSNIKTYEAREKDAEIIEKHLSNQQRIEAIEKRHASNEERWKKHLMQKAGIWEGYEDTLSESLSDTLSMSELSNIRPTVDSFF